MPTASPDLKRPAALITGSARRIGRAIAADLARHGWNLALHVRRSTPEADSLVADVAAAGGRSVVIAADLADLGEAPGLLASANDHLGPLILLVNNAAMFEPDAIGDLDPELWQRQMTVNLAAPVFLADAFARQLPAKSEGNIVNLIDQRVLRPTPRFLSYQLSKSALLAATVSMAQALAPRIRVNAIGPGPTLRSSRQTPADFARQVEALPLRRPPDLADFGRTVRYLVENRSVTGQMIALDGGQHLAWETADQQVPE
ncbi:MAG: SDR family oxidoreductase [Bauldia sp.]